MRTATPNLPMLVLACAISSASLGLAQSSPPPEPLPPPTRNPSPPIAATPESFPGTEPQDPPTGAFINEPGATDCYDDLTWENGGGEWFMDSLSRLHEFSSRSSLTHGRSTGLGQPLRGTSWLNRPYEVSLDAGAFLMTGRPADRVRAAHDMFAAVTVGWDWDHYWGAQARLGWSTPDLHAPVNPGDGADNLFLTDLSLMYYPWGDSRIRPYWRMGMGLTDVEYTNIFGVRQQEYLFTVPFGIGVKHQTSRWMAWKIEVVDNLAFGINETNTMNNFTLTAGFEARFGGRPSGYWAWSPRGYSW